jgi:hypothetical protein
LHGPAPSIDDRTSACRIADVGALQGQNLNISIQTFFGQTHLHLYLCHQDFAKFTQLPNRPMMSALFSKNLSEQPANRFRARGFIVLCGYPLIQCREIWRLQANPY